MSSRRAFSLVEMVCVIAVLAIVTAIVLPHWSASMQIQQLSMAAKRITSDLTLAQSRANFTSTSLTVSFSPTTNSYQIVGMPDPDRPSQTYTVNLAASPYGVTLTSASFGGSTSLAYDGFGTPKAGGTIVITLGSSTKTLTIDATSGKVTGS